MSIRSRILSPAQATSSHPVGWALAHHPMHQGTWRAEVRPARWRVPSPAQATSSRLVGWALAHHPIHQGKSRAKAALPAAVAVHHVLPAWRTTQAGTAGRTSARVRHVSASRQNHPSTRLPSDARQRVAMGRAQAVHTRLERWCGRWGVPGGRAGLHRTAHGRRVFAPSRAEASRCFSEARQDAEDGRRPRPLDPRR